MKLLILMTALFSLNAYAEDTVKVCVGEYALCAASGTVETGKIIYVNNVAFEEYNNLCIRCYIYGTTNDDDCCAICLTNDFGIWVVTDCNHKFHHKCYSKIEDTSICPLCRNATVDTKTLDY